MVRQADPGTLLFLLSHDGVTGICCHATWVVGSELRSSIYAASPLPTDPSPQSLPFHLFLRWSATELAKLGLNSVCSPDRLRTYDPPASDSRIAVM